MLPSITSTILYLIVAQIAYAETYKVSDSSASFTSIMERCIIDENLGKLIDINVHNERLYEERYAAERAQLTGRDRQKSLSKKDIAISERLAGEEFRDITSELKVCSQSPHKLQTDNEAEVQKFIKARTEPEVLEGIKTLRVSLICGYMTYKGSPGGNVVDLVREKLKTVKNSCISYWANQLYCANLANAPSSNVLPGPSDSPEGCEKLVLREQPTHLPVQKSTESKPTGTQ